jgi:hypothetical protein
MNNSILKKLILFEEYYVKSVGPFIYVYKTENLLENEIMAIGQLITLHFS